MACGDSVVRFLVVIRTRRQLPLGIVLEHRYEIVTLAVNNFIVS